MDRDEAARARRKRWAFGLATAVAGLLVLASQSAAEAGESPGTFAAGRLWLSEASLADQPEAVRKARERRNVVNVLKPALALAGAVLLAGIAWARRSGRPNRTRRVRDGALAALGILGFAGWWNFGQFHYPDFAHSHELFHYVIGAKYFPELGYTRMYECAVVADVEAGLGDRVARRHITDLRSYASVPAAPIAAKPEQCKRHFSPERWALFRSDLAWFRDRMTPRTWEAIQRDHGYNPTPVWGLLGSLLTRSGELDERRLATLTLLDPMLELLLWGAALIAFGWRASCVALLYWGTNHPAEYGWVGGAYLRHDWLAAVVIGLALLRSNRSVAGGFLLGSAALLRVFPVLLFAPFVLAAAVESWRQRRLVLPAQHARIAAGALLAAAIALPLSFWSTGSGAWPEFAENIRMHAASPSNTAIGLGTLVAFSPESRETVLRASGGEVDASWKRAHREARNTRWPVFALLAIALIALTARAARNASDWELAVLGIGLIPVVVDTSSYYTAIFLGYGFLASRQPSIGAALCLLSVAGWAAAGRWLAWDDISVATSAALLLFVGWSAATFRPAPAAEPSQGVTTSTGPSPSS